MERDKARFILCSSLHRHGRAIVFLLLLHVLSLGLGVGVQHLPVKLLLEFLGAGEADIPVFSLHLSAGHGDEEPVFALHDPHKVGNHRT